MNYKKGQWVVFSRTIFTNSNGNLHIGKATGSVMVLNQFERKRKPDHVFAVCDEEEDALNIYNNILDGWDNYDSKVREKYNEARELKNSQIEIFKKISQRISS